ncbi:conserved hypothetical protein [Streptomyces pristinaespiralis ATCC 25486]|uniref:Uncharacterized protein n=1 Tax=Streptomyces pristinaespiralis (strain ATCC 25486 / DSM 40338 / CBS 914.69 / JCM 4507 / KCC S-0507 / NBRC 13074 / NRRL 2958 / 5647) TaxID=457429 RepID=B5H929_STRE2|nr:conserved hypothetical protein [Streptomyces pristinaespiralis ATCC 25486]
MGVPRHACRAALGHARMGDARRVPAHDTARPAAAGPAGRAARRLGADRVRQRLVRVGRRTSARRRAAGAAGRRPAPVPDRGPPVAAHPRRRDARPLPACRRRPGGRPVRRRVLPRPDKRAAGGRGRGRRRGMAVRRRTRAVGLLRRTRPEHVRDLARPGVEAEGGGGVGGEG